VAKNTTTTAPKTHPIRAEDPWTAVAIDLLGPFNVTNRSHKYVIIMTDLFTRWAVILPLQDTSAAEIAKAIINVFFLYGPPQKMPIDQGNELVYQVSFYTAGFFFFSPYIKPFLRKTVKFFLLIEKKKDKPIICNCNFMQHFPGFYSLDKEHRKMISCWSQCRFCHFDELAQAFTLQHAVFHSSILSSIAERRVFLALAYSDYEELFTLTFSVTMKS